MRPWKKYKKLISQILIRTHRGIFNNYVVCFIHINFIRITHGTKQLYLFKCSLQCGHHMTIRICSRVPYHDLCCLACISETYATISTSGYVPYSIGVGLGAS